MSQVHLQVHLEMPAKSPRRKPQRQSQRQESQRHLRARPPAAHSRKPQAAKFKAKSKVKSNLKSKSKWVYGFGGGKAEGRAAMRDLLGGKGANLAEMANLGLPVPPGFTITTEVCTYFYANGKAYPPDLERQVTAALGHLGKLTGNGFGDPRDPLLVSVRSGARASMPG